MRCLFALDAPAATTGAASIQFGWLNASEPNRVYHQVNHTNADQRGVLRVSSGASDTTHPTRACLPTDTIATEMLWDTVADEVIHRYQGAFAQRVTSADTTIPDSSLDHTFKVQIGTENTNADRTMRLYGLELSYYNRDRQS